MSRIIVKNLPVKATESDVRTHFQSKGVITDVKLLRKRDGSSRRFAFVGFKTDSEAEEAAKYFNLSFMNSSRLQVALAKALGDEELEKRKETLKRKRFNDQLQQDENNKSIKVNTDSNEKLEEFLKVMQPQNKTAMWKNDNTDSSAPIKVDSNHDDDDDDVNDIPTLTGAVTNTDNSDSANQKSGDDRENENNEEEDWDPTAQLDSDPTEEPEMTDEEWLKKRQTRIKENGEKPVNLEKASTIETSTEHENDEIVPESNRLFVRNLAFTVSRVDLLELFGQFGELMQVHIPLDPKTDKPKGIAFVEYNDAQSSRLARETLDGTSFQGRLLHIIYAENQRNYELDEFDIKQMPLKKQKALKRRMQANKQQFSWNSLYMNKDAVLEATAAKLNVSKSELLDPHSSNMAVKQALAESSVLENVQSYFKSKNIDLARFQPGKSQELSDTTILAKNIPFGISALEIQDMFSPYGEVIRTLMPPDGGIAIIQFKFPSDGRNAFKKLAFRRIGESILYLQKAPKGVTTETEDSPVAATSTSDATASNSNTNVTAAADILLPEETTDNNADIRTSVFVKNLNFTTTLDSLIKHFQGSPGFVSAVIKTKPDPKDTKRQLSMGYGFIEFRTLSQAQTAIKVLGDTELDGHKLQLKISSRGQDNNEKAKPNKGSGSTKIVIKNIPFETSKQDIVELFGTFGHLRSVRVPRKFNRQTRGFAFAEYATPKEAEHAMESLRGAHLLGRRLVMDFAQADAEDAEEEISRMEAKVANQMNAIDSQSGRLGGKQRGFDMEEN